MDISIFIKLSLVKSMVTGPPMRSNVVGVGAAISTTTFADREVRTWTGDSSHNQSYGETGARAAKLAGALRSLGVDADQRVATLMYDSGMIRNPVSVSALTSG